MKNIFVSFLGLGVLSIPLLCSGQERLMDTVKISKEQPQNKFTPLKIFPQKEVTTVNNLSSQMQAGFPVYMKENGYGAVSSPSFRGTTAQQTSVFWNGLPVNSLLLGQSDFSNFSPQAYSTLSVVPGGNGFSLGSNAIGGSIFLENQFPSTEGLSGRIIAENASFQTYHAGIDAGFRKGNTAFIGNFHYTESENLYEVPEKKYRNLNGEFHSFNGILGMQYKILPHWNMHMITENGYRYRNFPVFFDTQTKTGYLDQFSRNILTSQWKKQLLSLNTSIGNIQEAYRFYPNTAKDFSLGSRARQWILKQDILYQILPNLRIFSFNDVQWQKAYGLSQKDLNPKRNIFSTALGASWSPLKKVNLSGGIRKEFGSMSSPLLYHAEAEVKLNDQFSSQISFQKNYRNPSFNDLFWKPGGNEQILPENSRQWEAKFKFATQKWNLQLNGYHMDIQDMIRWLPNMQGIYQAQNTQKVISKGAEFYLTHSNQYAQWKFLTQTNFSYNRSIDQSSGLQLSFAPKYILNAQQDIQYKNLQLWLQGRYVSAASISTSENAEYLPAFCVINMGTVYTFRKKVSLGISVHNLMNEVYSTAYHYYQPLRNYQIKLQYTL